VPRCHFSPRYKLVSPLEEHWKGIVMIFFPRRDVMALLFQVIVGLLIHKG